MYTLKNINSRFLKILTMRLPFAAAQLKGSGKYPQIFGGVKFYRADCGNILVSAAVTGLPTASDECASKFIAMHIHENGICDAFSDEPFADAGEHYDPNGCPHPAHAGDLVPLFVTDGGLAWSAILYDSFTSNEIIGKSVIIHRMPDDFMTQPSGNAGERIACGKIVRI